MILRPKSIRLRKVTFAHGIKVFNVSPICIQGIDFRIQDIQVVMDLQ